MGSGGTVYSIHPCTPQCDIHVQYQVSAQNVTSNSTLGKVLDRHEHFVSNDLELLLYKGDLAMSSDEETAYTQLEIGQSSLITASECCELCAAVDMQTADRHVDASSSLLSVHIDSEVWHRVRSRRMEDVTVKDYQ